MNQQQDRWSEEELEELGIKKRCSERQRLRDNRDMVKAYEKIYR